MQNIEIFDTTLRDGAQGEGVIFSHEDKIKVIRALDEFGVDYIEAGNPASNPKDRELLRYASGHLHLKNAKLTAFGSTCRVGAIAAEDPGLNALTECGVDTAAIFGKSSVFHVEKVLGTTKEENLRMIGDSVEYLVSRGMRVFFDAEHFFDGYKYDPEYALATIQKAAVSGASVIVLCDTNGGSLPVEIEQITRRMVQSVPLPFAIHCHNDAGLATACTLAGVAAGARQVQGTVNGYGERCGNADLCQIIPNLVFKMGYGTSKAIAFEHLTQTARLISEIANLSMDEHSPYVGHSAFSHKGGMHIDGVLKDSRSFEHISPESVGNQRHFLVSEMAGRGALLTRVQSFAPDLQKGSEETKRIMETLKELENIEIGRAHV